MNNTKIILSIGLLGALGVGAWFGRKKYLEHQEKLKIKEALNEELRKNLPSASIYYGSNIRGLVQRNRQTDNKGRYLRNNSNVQCLALN